MKIYIWPKTKTGKWSAISTILFIVLMALKFMDLTISIRLPLPTPIIAALGVVGFALGMISIIKNKEKALLTLISVPIGLLIIFWVAAEIAFPH